ncbi:MAG: hypothetical protein NTV01_02735 [Bacteroidia bacterium]|nr:hypothetical protein [Bacteroidia bacterium]
MKTHDTLRIILSVFALGLALMFILPGAIAQYKIAQFKQVLIRKDRL